MVLAPALPWSSVTGSFFSSFLVDSSAAIMYSRVGTIIPRIAVIGDSLKSMCIGS